MDKINKSIYILALFLISFPFLGNNKSNGASPLIKNILQQDSVSLNSDTLSVLNDTTAIDSIKPKKEMLESVVDYTANDSIIFTAGNIGHLYGDSKIDYQKLSINGEKIKINMDSSVVHASYGVDSIGKEFGFPIFSDNGTEYEMKSVSYNFKSKKGYIRNVITEQGEGYIVAEKAKKNADDTFFMCNGKYTTCDHHDHPHFYLMLTKAKVRPQKNIVTGPAYLVIEDLPLPLAIPFGFFPFSQKYSSGIIMPSYGDDMDKGFNLRNGGYYFAINDYIDLALTGEIYTKGSWGLNAHSNYRKRYKYSGAFDISYLFSKDGDKHDTDYTEYKDFKLSWQHAQDPKANQFRTLSANVDYQTGSYSQNNQESKYSISGTQNTRNSSVTFTQTFPNSPLTLAGNINASQIMQDSTVSLTLPNLTANINRIHPFKRKNAVGSEKWFEKIYFNYTGEFRNSITTKNDQLFKSGLKDWDNAMQHQIPVSATFNVFNYINLTTSFNYTERWYTKKITQQWDAVRNQNVKADTINGINRVYNYDYSIALQTKMYGYYKPVFKVGKIQQIRHVFTPTISYTGSPDFGSSSFGYYERYMYFDAEGRQREYVYSPYQYELFGVPGIGKQGNIGFNFENNLEMKVLTQNDSTKIISLIDNLGIRFSYNTMADQFRWSNINTSMRLKPTKSFTINMNAEFDPYTYTYDESTKTGRRVDKLRISKGEGIGRLMRTGLSLSPSLNQDTFKKWFGKGTDKNAASNKKNYDILDETEDNLLEGEDSDPFASPRESLFANNSENNTYDSDGYLKNEITWNLTFNYTMNYGYTSTFNREKNEFNRRLTQNIGINASIQPTKNWSLSLITSYDVNEKKLAHMICNIGRDLHCWNISANFIPTGPNPSYYVSIRVNSSLLQDLKYEKRGQPTSYDPSWR